MRTRCPSRPVVAIALLLAVAIGSLHERAAAWGNDGHRIIGTIATAQVSESTAKALRELLGDETTADACTWADEIRRDRSYDWVKPLHYINVPRGSERLDLARDGAEGQQVVSAIGKYKAILADTTKPKAERVEALKFVLHFVGDVHQPLHVSYADDLGGNKLSLKSFGKKSNLHKVWDTDLIDRELSRMRSGGWAVLSANLREAIKPEQRTKWASSRDPLQWANESLAITRTIYANPPQGNGDVDDAYFTRWMPTVNERLQMAGVRLAVLLDEALAPGEAKPSSSKKDAGPKKDAESKKDGAPAKNGAPSKNGAPAKAPA
ncbi:MAG: S1/P1 nuclease [Phycisphaerae bacterium]|nr:S1/P1 nuclease [Phycisphaerae bacterium]